MPSSASLTIYAQSNSESTAGKLETGAPDVSYPGIGGPYQANTAVTPGNITIVGGVFNVTGGVGAAAIGGATYSPGGNITIKGGFVTATSSVGGGAAIGGGANADGGTINITGGKVTATGRGGAGIGGGSYGKSGTINISSGTVTATADGSAAIGGGSNGAGETINITGGTITATNSGETGGAAIGGGINAAGGKITIENATIAKATASAGAAIGSGGGETAGTTTVIIGTGAIISNAGSYNGAGIGSGQNSSTSCSVTIQSGANVKAGSTLGAGIGGGNGASNFSVTIQGGTVNAWAGGIGTQDGNGNLSAYGGAAIGGGANTSGGNVSISGGTVTARAIGGGAGIGSGANTSTSATTDSGTITISGGTVTATATHRAAGIGGGRRSNGGTITISGGTIVANGSDAAGIGHGGEDTLWEGQGSFNIPIIDDPTQDVGGAWYDSIVPIDGTNKATTDGTVTFTYTDTVSITASSYPAAVTLDEEFMYSDTGENVNGSSITAEKTLVPYSNHVHSFTYSAEGATLTATCNAPGCILVDHKATLTINAPTELIYDGTAKAVTVIGEIPGVTTPDIVYKQDETILAAAPVNAGTYTASITLGEGDGAATASVTYTIIPKQYTIVIGTDIDNGTVTADKNAFTEGETVTLTVTPAEGYALDSLTYTQDGSETPVTIENNTFTMPAGNVTVNAVFAKLYALNLPVGEPYGSVTAFVNGAEATEARSGETVSLVFTLNEGYQIQYAFPSPVTAFYTLDGTEKKKDAYSESGNTYTFTMPAADISSWRVLNGRSICTVWFDPDNEGTRSQNNVYYGDSVSCPDDPSKEGFRFLGWYQVLGESLADAPFDFEMSITGDITLRAKWEQLYAVAIDGNITGGEVTTDKATAAPDDTVTLTVEPATGYALDTLTVMQGETPVTVTNNQFTMPSGNVTVSATFKQLYTVSVSKNALITQTFTVDGQAVTPTDVDENSMTLQIPAGAVVSITAAPVDSSEHRIEDIDIRREDTHDHFGTVTDGENGARTATFTMPESEVNVHVNVQETGWPVNTGVPVYDGENVIFKVTATPHHGEACTPITLTVEKADDVTLDSMDYVYYDNAAGEEITVSLTPDADGKYTFTMPDSWVSVRPEYSLNRAHRIINELGDGPSVYLVFRKDEYNMFTVETTTANAGDTVRVYPNGGTLQGFKVNGKEVAVSGYESDPYYEFTMPDGNATLTGLVTYSLQTYRVEHGTVTVQVGDGEAIDMSGGTWLSVPAGAQVKVTATPVAGYTLYRLTYRMDGQYGRGSDEKGGVEIQSGVPFTMPGGNIVIDAEFSTPWNHLRNQIDNARDGDTITLTEDATAPAGEGCLGISYKSITVDLNGHTINRNLTAPTDYGCVISVDSSAALTLVDSVGGGMITGGNNNYNGGGIAVAGTLNLQGGKITGNSASDGGGVAVISSGAVFTLTGGEISGNANTTERSSAGVLYTSGAMNVSGSPVVTHAVYVDLNRKLHVTGALTNATPIPVIIAGGVGVPFTDGLPNNGSAANFKSASDDYRVRVNADGEAELKTVHSVTVAEDIANGTVTADLTTATEGDAVTLTATPAEGYAFSHFTVTDASGESVSVSPEGRIIMPDSNVTVTATFITEWKWLQNRMAEGWTITLEKDITCADQSEGPLVVPKDVTSTLDLNGHTVNRGLAGKDAVEGGNVISVRGTLTVNDSSTDKTGKITGGNNSAAGGGVMLDGTFTLNGGAVTGNRTGTYAGGILNYGTFNMTGGAISDNSAQNAGGVYNGGTFNLSGGLICGNTASDSFGGGVYNNLGSVFNMSGSASIVGNHAATGGGVFNGGAFTLSESASITDNTANNGGGVANMGTFNMTGSAAITGNAATEAGGGLYHAGSAITLSGDIALSGNTGGDIHLLEVSPENKPVLNISGALTNADPIGVSYEVLEGTLPDTIPFTQGLNGNGSAANFKSADENYRVRVNDAGEAELYALTFHTVTFDPGNGDEATTQPVAENETAARPDDPTKEGHRFLGWYQDDTEFDFDTPITEDITLTARWAAPVTLTAAMQDANGNSVSGRVTLPEGDVYPGDEVTLTAPRVSGYNFTGWFAEGGAENLCRDLGYTFTVGDVTAFVARYEALATACITIDGGDSYTVNGSEQSVEIMQYYPVGTEITVATDKENFDYWTNGYGMVLSRDRVYTFTVTSAETVKAVFKAKVVADKATLIFESFYKQVLGRSQLALGNTITLPPLPIRNGYNTLGWDLNGDGALSADDTLDAAIQRGLDNEGQSVTIYAVYELKPVKYIVTVNGGTGSGSYDIDARVSIRANQPEAGKIFSHWEDENGNTVSYNTSHSFYINKNVTFNAVYADDTEAVEAKGTTKIVNMYKNTNGINLTFVSESTVPEGCVIQKAGVIGTGNAEKAANPETFTDQTAEYVRGDACSGSLYQYTWTKGTANLGNTLYVRAYLVYTDQNGNTQTVYGDVVSQDFEK